MVVKPNETPSFGGDFSVESYPKVTGAGPVRLLGLTP